jgi:hypothetical protein
MKGKYDWKKEAMAPGKLHTYVWTDNGKTYHWLSYHKSWTIHRPEDCPKGHDNNAPVANSTEDKDSEAGKRPRMIIDCQQWRI